MSKKNVEVVRQINAAFNAGQYEAMAEFFEAEAEFVDHIPLPDVAPSARGPDEIRAVVDAWVDGFQGFEAHVVEYLELGDFVVTVTHWRFVSRNEGIEMEWKGAEAWQLHDGKVIWGQVAFRDKDAALEAVRLQNQARPRL
jgi:ketosteroid isomerase-like protein